MKKTHNIRGIILDVDGVIIGEKEGYNFPAPHVDVLAALKKIRSHGIYVVLCSAKTLFAVKDIMELSHLDNLHITDGGAIIVDPFGGGIKKLFPLEKHIAKKVIGTFLREGVYTEVYTSDTYLIDKAHIGDITDKHAKILHRRPDAVASLEREAHIYDITKIMFVARDEAEKEKIIKVFSPFEKQITLRWGIHPRVLPLQFGFITSPTVSKKHAMIEIATTYDIPLENLLGIGDSTSDWEFMELCGFAGVVSNGTNELKYLARTKGTAKYCIGGSVDRNGTLDIFAYFNLMGKT